jgi:hypothetical protein
MVSCVAYTFFAQKTGYNGEEGNVQVSSRLDPSGLLQKVQDVSGEDFRSGCPRLRPGNSLTPAVSSTRTVTVFVRVQGERTSSLSY